MVNTSLRISLFCIALFLFSCAQKDPGYNKVKADPEKSNMDVVIDNFTATGKQENKILWELKSDKAYINNDAGEVHILKVDLFYYDDKGQKVHIIGDEGVLQQKKRIMTLDGNVKVYSPNGRKLFTDHLVWEEKTRQLHTDSPIKISLPGGDELNGRNLRADMNLNKIIIDQATGKVRQK